MHVPCKLLLCIIWQNLHMHEGEHSVLDRKQFCTQGHRKRHCSCISLTAILVQIAELHMTTKSMKCLRAYVNRSMIKLKSNSHTFSGLEKVRVIQCHCHCILENLVAAWQVGLTCYAYKYSRLHLNLLSPNTHNTKLDRRACLNLCLLAINLITLMTCASWFDADLSIMHQLQLKS